MEKNGKKSCTRSSRNIDRWYFFVKHQIDRNNMSIAYYITEQMLPDVFTKALQGYLIVKFRDIIMGRKYIDTLNTGPTSTKERVVNLYEVDFSTKTKTKTGNK